MNNIMIAKKDKNIQERFAEKFADYPVEVFIHDNQKSSINVDAHWHNCIEILFMIKGSAHQQVNGDNFLLNENSVIILHEGSIHSTICDNNEDVKILVIKFMPDLIYGSQMSFAESKYIHAFINSNHNLPYLITQCYGEKDILKSLMMRIYDEYSQKEIAYELYVKGYIQHIIAYLVRNNILKTAPIIVKSERSKKIEILIRYIEKNYHLDISLKTASDFIHISYYHLSRLFKDYTGQNFKHYLDFVRVCEAEKMIINTDKSITQIALDVGFPNISSFNRVFNRIRHYNPSVLKKQKLINSKQKSTGLD